MKYFSILCFFILFCLKVYAQPFQITGKVTGNEGKPVKNVRISLTGIQEEILTDYKGEFSLTVEKSSTYKLSAVHNGYNFFTTLIIVNSNQNISIQLNPITQHVEEVVIIDNHINDKKREESLNLEIVNPAFIQRHLGGSLMKTLERLPGIKTIGIGSGNAKPLIRGLGFNRVVVLDKGIKHEGQQWGADHGLELDQFAAGEVELLKGAASFLYGSDAIGGSIAIKPPAVPAKNYVGGTVNLIGKTNNNLYGTSVNFAGRSDKWFADGRFTHQDYSDYRVPTDKVYVYDYEVPLVKNYLRNTAGRETGLHLNTGYIHDNFRSVFFISNIFQKSGFFANAHGLEPRKVDEKLHDQSNRDLLMPNQQVNHFKILNNTRIKINNHLLEAEAGFQRNFRQEFSQYVNHGYMPPLYPLNLNIPENLERAFDKKVYSINLRDNFQLNKHQLTIGINSEYQENSINGWTFLTPAFNQFTSGAFIYDKIKVNEQLILHGAFRYDYGKIRMFKYTDWFTSVNEQLIRAHDLNRSFNSFVYSAGLNYNPENFEIKANIGKSFRMPIAKELGANGVNYHYFSYEKGNPSLSPEVSYQADLSIGYHQKDWSLQLSPFYNYFPNYIYLNPTAHYDYFYGAGNQVFEYTQSRVKRYGAELSFKYQFIRNLETEILAEYLVSRQISGAKKGYSLPFSPPPSLLFNLTWLPTINGKTGKNYISADFRITTKQENIVPPEKKTPGYQIINLQAGTSINLYNQPVNISLQAQNLLNAQYLVHTSFYRLIELPEAGRNFILSLKVPFTIKKN